MELFNCDICGESYPTYERREYLPPESDELQEDVRTDELCPECSTKKPNVRIYRREDDIAKARENL